MKHKRAILKAWLLAAVLLLAGCAPTGQESTVSVSSAVEAGEEETIDPAESSDAKEADISAEVSTAEDAAEEIPYSFPLLDEDELKLELVEAVDFQIGSRVILVRSENRTEQDLIVNLDHIHINDSIVVSDRISLYPRAGKNESNVLGDLKEAVLEAEQEGITVDKISFLLSVNSSERDESGNRKIVFEGPKEVIFPENFKPRQVCEPTLSMRVEEQILREDESVRITLMNLGKFVGIGDYYVLEGILKAENLSDETIPFEIQGIRLNGYYLEISGTKKGSLPPGSAIYSGFSVARSDIQKAEITEIENVELLILTSQKENVGTIYTNAGGTWYPVALAEHGTGEETSGLGVPVYEDDYVVIEFCGAENIWNERAYSGGGGYGHFTWNFNFSNKTDKELRISFEDFVIDGELDQGEIFDRYMIICELGANSRTKDTVWQSIEEPLPLPEISFRVVVQSAGGGKIYNSSEEYVTITQEMIEN